MMSPDDFYRDKGLPAYSAMLADEAMRRRDAVKLQQEAMQAASRFQDMVELSRSKEDAWRLANELSLVLKPSKPAEKPKPAVKPKPKAEPLPSGKRIIKLKD
jgi:hypothetical protein